MNKTKFLIFVFSFLIVLSIAIIIIDKTKEKKEDVEDSFGLGEIYEEVNLASNESFDIVSKDDITMYLSTDLSDEDDFVYAKDLNNFGEYFFIARNIPLEVQSKLRGLYSKDEEENFIFYSDEIYTYLIKSSEYSYMIEGIIKSFINN